MTPEHPQSQRGPARILTLLPSVTAAAVRKRHVVPSPQAHCFRTMETEAGWLRRYRGTRVPARSAAVTLAWALQRDRLVPLTNVTFSSVRSTWLRQALLSGTRDFGEESDGDVLVLVV